LRIILRTGVAGLLIAIVWTVGLIGLGLVLMPRFDASASPTGMIADAKSLAEKHVGPLAIIVIDDGQVAAMHYQSTGNPIGPSSRFQMASVSKWVAAWTVLRLAEQGRIDLDAPVNQYLKRWKLTGNEGVLAQITPRRLLAHSAGLTDGLGYCGFQGVAEVQSLPASLSKADDACPGLDGRTRAGEKPGQIWRYSGGGYGVLQLLVEDVTGESFGAYAKREVLIPLGMTRSTFDATEAAAGLVDSYNSNGQLEATRFYANVAAASLYSTPEDLVRFVLAHTDGNDGTKAGRDVLSRATLKDMTTGHANMFGIPVWGLGVSLYSQINGLGLVIGHDGGNRPAINTTVRLDISQRDAIVVLATGSSGLAGRIGGAWSAPRIPNITPLRLYGSVFRMAPWIGGGILLSFLFASFLGWRALRRQKAA
jgi:CubicO group peptidase (beta-lactamase class C family)